MGAKALHVEGVPRDMQSVDGKLNRISGEGRVVLTASSPSERAWESARLGHGFLTLHLFDALRGPAGLREGERIGKGHWLPVKEVMLTRRSGDFAAHGRFRRILFGIIRHICYAHRVTLRQQRGEDAILGISREALCQTQAALSHGTHQAEAARSFLWYLHKLTALRN
jgi:hypothetical protein